MLASTTILTSLIAAGAMGIACAVLSVFVISRRWAFIGEGIGHAGFGGAGTIWLLSLLIPSLDQPLIIYGGVVVFCVATALAIGWVTRRQRLNSDTAIGIFLVASLAWGFLGSSVYTHFHHASPQRLPDLLFGNFTTISPTHAISSVMICAAVLVVIMMLGKEIIYYSFDPLLAEVSGVRAGFIHYLMMILLAMTIIIGIPIAGSVLVTALLVLPGATAMMLSQKLKTVVLLSVLLGLFSALAGTAISTFFRYLPAGPMMVLVLFILFLIAFIATRTRARAAAG
jgi:manganese/iron transport system permease protein